MKLIDAFNWLVRLDPHTFGVRKRGEEPLKDPYFVSVNAMYKGSFRVQLRGDKDYQDNLKDSTVTKDYYCSDIQDDESKILGLAYLGTLYLRQRGDFEDENEGMTILQRLVHKKRQESMREESYRAY